MSKVILTRYLYLFDEVGLTFITSLLKKRSLEECYFWISELYLSGFIEQSWELLWFVYYDFYYINNPYFRPFIHKKSVEGGLKSALTVVKNLFKMKSSSEVFVTRQYNNCVKDITQVFRGKKPNWLLSIPNKYHGLFRFIDKKMYHFAVCSLPDVIENDDEIFMAIQIYFQLPDEQIKSFQSEFNCNVKQNELAGDLATDELATDEPLTDTVDNQYNNSIHVLWSIICLLIFNRDYTSNKKKIYIACSDSEYNHIMEIHNDPIPLSKYNNPQIYRTLQHKRLYSIDPICSSFHLLRENVENINECYRYHWEYYAYLSPLWHDRFNMYHITIDPEKKKIIFHDDDELEDFYSQYGYEPDEQSYETESKRMVHISDNNWNSWYNSIFVSSDKKPIYEFNEEFRFKY
jgi:hypothetical protein